MQKLSKQKQQTSHLLLVHSGGRRAEPLELDQGWHWMKGGEAHVWRCGICCPNTAQSTEREKGTLSLCPCGSQLKCGHRMTCCCCLLSLCLLGEVCSASPKEPEQWEFHLYGKWGKGKYADTEWTAHLASLAYMDCKDLSQVRTSTQSNETKKLQTHTDLLWHIFTNIYRCIPIYALYPHTQILICTLLYMYHMYMHVCTHMKMWTNIST